MVPGFACPNGHASESTDYCDTCGSPMVRTSTPSAPAESPPGRSTSAGSTSIGSTAAESTAAKPVGVVCPNCGVMNAPGALFCEACGYDYTTGTMPRPAEASILDLDTPLPQSTASAAAPPADEAPVPSPADEPPVPSRTAQAPETSPDVSRSAAPAPENETGAFDWVLEIWVDPEWYALQESPDPLPSPGLPDIVPLRQRSLLIGRPSRSRNIDPDIDCEPDSGISRRQAELSTDGTRWFIEDLGSANGTFVADASAGMPSQPIPTGRRHELSGDERIYLGAWTRLVLRRATAEERDAYASS